MPAMVRSSGKAKKIAYEIMGMPQNSNKKTKKQKKNDTRLNMEEALTVK